MMSELPVVSVHIPPALRNLVDGQAELMGSGETVAEVLEALGHRYPHWRGQLFQADGSLTAGVSIHVGAHTLADRDSLAMPIEQADLINVQLSGPAALHAAEPVISAPHPSGHPHDLSIGA